MKKLGYYHVISMKEEAFGLFINDGGADKSELPGQLATTLIKTFKFPIGKVLKLKTIAEVVTFADENNIGIMICLDVVDSGIMTEKQAVEAMKTLDLDPELEALIKKDTEKAMLRHLGLDKLFGDVDDDDDCDGDCDNCQCKTQKEDKKELRIACVSVFNENTKELDSYTVAAYNDEHLMSTVKDIIIKNDYAPDILIDVIGTGAVIDLLRETEGIHIAAGFCELSQFNIKLSKI